VTSTSNGFISYTGEESARGEDRRRRRTGDVAMASARRKTLTRKVREGIVVGLVSGSERGLGPVVVGLVLKGANAR
jgi:hypothetical protein